MPGADLTITDGELGGDYEDDDVGGFVTTTTAASAVRHQLLTDLGAWVGDPDAGREQRGIRGRNASQRELELDRDSVKRALEKLEDAELIGDIDIKIKRDPTGRFALEIGSRDKQGGGTIASTVLLNEFGG